MKTPIFSALTVSCAFIFAFVTSGFIPVTAYAIKPTDPGSNASLHRNNNAKDSTSKKDDVAYTQPEFTVVQDNSAENTATAISPALSSSAELASAKSTPKQNNPSGNNGFIKVNEEELPDSIPNNDPHVSCKVNVEFYNYDKNPAYRADVSFALQSPTTKNGQTITVTGDTNPFIGEDAAGGGNDLDAVRTYQLAFTGPAHEKQGYHVKLTINADGSRGADVKHKVFWVKPCAQPGQVLPATTTAIPGKTLSTSTVVASQSLPTKLPSTGMQYVTFLSIFIASALAYAGGMILQVYRLRRI